MTLPRAPDCPVSPRFLLEDCFPGYFNINSCSANGISIHNNALRSALKPWFLRSRFPNARMDTLCAADASKYQCSIQKGFLNFTLKGESVSIHLPNMSDRLHRKSNWNGAIYQVKISNQEIKYQVEMWFDLG